MRGRSNASCYMTIFALAAKDLWGCGVMYLATWLCVTVALAATTMALYVGAYRASPPALPLASAVWAVAIASFLRLTWRHITGAITDDVRSGAIASRMRYPLPYLGFIAADHMGRSLPIAAPFLCLAAYLAGGFPTLASPSVSLAYCGALIVASMTISMELYMLMGLTAFWIEDASPVLRIVEKIIVVLGGSIVPIALLPAGARTIIEYIPFTATGFAAQVTSMDFVTRAPRLLGIAWGWVVVCGLVLFVVWRRASTRVEVNGG